MGRKLSKKLARRAEQREETKKEAKIEGQNNSQSVEIHTCGDCSHIIHDPKDETRMIGCDMQKMLFRWRRVNECDGEAKCPIARLEYANGHLRGERE